MKASKRLMKNKDSLIAKLNFERFVMGLSNARAYAAANQIAQNPGRAYNPLIFYGGTGLGKTHLLHSIGNFIREHDPNVSVLCIDAEQFSRGMQKALRNETLDAFKHRFETADVLLFDVVQFLADRRKKKYQAVFFQILEHLFAISKTDCIDLLLLS
jgi:chromosomal replication initiator protein